MATRHGSAEVSLPSDREILIVRRFEARRALVWQALTEPRRLLRWWGPDWCPLVACDVDLRVGGAWRYVARDIEGNELGWHGVYRDIAPEERIVSTEVFEGYPDAESVNTMTLDEVNGVTTLRTVVLHSSREHRDGHVESGMEGGMQVTFNRLDDLLEAHDTPAERFRRAADRFGECVDGVRADQWDLPAPCEGWVARDVVAHLVEWVPAFLTQASVVVPPGPSVVDDPAASWHHLARHLQQLLDDRDSASREFDAGPPGVMTVAAALDMVVTGDLIIHTWDLARATGQDETLDPEVVATMLAGMQAYDEQLRTSGHYGPKVEVPADADEQTKLIAFTGRTP